MMCRQTAIRGKRVQQYHNNALKMRDSGYFWKNLGLIGGEMKMMEYARQNESSNLVQYFNLIAFAVTRVQSTHII